MTICISCGADWSQGEFSADCPQCGGGALERACPVCGGRCGRMWMRAVLDSQESNMAHWIGSCGLPAEEQRALFEVKRRTIRCNSIAYRQGFIEVQPAIHDNCINIETWQIDPNTDISAINLTDDALSENAITGNTELELSIENAEQLVGLLQSAIKRLKPNSNI